MLAALRKTPETLREGLRAGEPHHLPRGCSEGWGGVLGVSLSALAPNHCPSSAVEVSSTRTKRRPGCLRGRRAPPCAPCPLCSAPRAGHTSLTRPVLPRASGPGRAHRENLGSEASALSRDAPAGRAWGFPSLPQISASSHCPCPSERLDLGASVPPFAGEARPVLHLAAAWMG